MDENKKNNEVNELKIPTPPPVVPKKETPKKEGSQKAPNKKLLILIPVIVAIVVVAVVLAVILKNGNDKNKETTLAPIVVTDENGVPVTNADGEPVTVVPETEVYEYTDANGEKKTTVVYKDVTVNVPVTDKNGEAVTDKNGEVVTTQKTITPTTQKNSNVVVGTTGVAVTDGQGHTTVDEDGNIFTTIVEITSSPAIVDVADIDWKTSLGGTSEDYVSSMITFKDGTYLSSTVTNSTDGDFTKFKDLGYATPYTVLTKYSKNGDITWQGALGSKRGLTAITKLVALDDGGFYAVGYGRNIGGKNGKGYYDGAVFKFDKKGQQLWVSTFGTSTVDLFESACLTKDGGVVVAGSVGNNDKDAAGFGKPEYNSAACVVKYDSDGNLVWKNIVGGNKDGFEGVVEDNEGNIFCVGNFYSGDLFKNQGYADGGIVKFTSGGEYVKVVPIAGTGMENFRGITACKDGGIVVVGQSNSSDAGSTDSFFVSDLAARGGYDAYIIKYDSDLSLAFAKTFRGQNNEDLTCVVETEDGSFIAAGSSNSSSRDLKGITTRGANDIVIASFNRSGELSWARSFGGTKAESASAICLAKDGGYVVAGKTLSKDIDMKGIAQYVSDKAVGVIVKFPE